MRSGSHPPARPLGRLGRTTGFLLAILLATSPALAGSFGMASVWVDHDPIYFTSSLDKVKAQGAARLYGSPTNVDWGCVELHIYSSQCGTTGSNHATPYGTAGFDNFICVGGPFAPGQFIECVKTVYNTGGYSCGPVQYVSRRNCCDATHHIVSADGVAITYFPQTISIPMTSVPESVTCIYTGICGGGGPGCGGGSVAVQPSSATSALNVAPPGEGRSERLQQEAAPKAADQATNEVATRVWALQLGSNETVDPSTLAVELGFRKFGSPRATTLRGHRFVDSEYAIVGPGSGGFYGRGMRGSAPDREREWAARYHERASGGGPVLVVEGVEHTRNSRWTDTPSLVLDGVLEADRANYGTRIAIKAYFWHGNLDDIFILWGSDVVPEQSMRDLRLQLTLDPPTTEHPVVVAYGEVTLGRRSRIRQAAVIVPQCCCGAQFCI